MVDRPDRDEAAVIRAAMTGDRAAFGALVRAYQRRAYAAAYTYVRQRETALDLAQDAFVRAWQARERFDPALPFYPWLYRILRNLCLNHLERQGRRGEQSLEAMGESGFDTPDPAANLERDAALAELRRQIHTGMDGLSAEHREILQLRHFLDLSYTEIAQCLEIPPGTVMSRLHAARKALAARLEGAL